MPTKRYWGVELIYWINLNNLLSSPLDEDYTLVARSLMGLIISGCANRPSHRAFIKILHAFGASSPFASSSSMEAEPSGTNGVAAGLRLLTLVMDLYKSTLYSLVGVIKHIKN